MAKVRSAGVAVPAIFFVDIEKRSLYMEFIVDAVPVKNFLVSSQANPSSFEVLCDRIGSSIANTHNASVIHGDLTTSNMLYDGAAKKLVLISHICRFSVS